MATMLVAALALSGLRGLETRNYKHRLENFNNMQYLGRMSIGPFNVTGIFDTGSFDLLVMSTRCGHCANQKYDHSQSSTYQADPEGLRVRHSFGSGQVISRRGYERVQAGTLVADKQEIWEIEDHDIPALDVSGCDAIVGVGPTQGPGDSRLQGEKTLLMNFAVDRFSVCLERGGLTKPGWFEWQGQRGTKGDSAFVSAPVVGKHHWVVKQTAVKARTPDGALEDTGLCTDGCGAIVDSGTSMILVPSKHIKVLAKYIQIKTDCSNLKQLPTLHLTLGGHTTAIPPRAYVLRVKKSDGSFRCRSGISTLEKQSQVGPVWVLGLPFMREYVTVFDRTERQVRFAVAAQDCSILPFKDASTTPAPTTNTSLVLHHAQEQEDDEAPEVDERLNLYPSWARAGGVNIEL